MDDRVVNDKIARPRRNGVCNRCAIMDDLGVGQGQFELSPDKMLKDGPDIGFPRRLSLPINGPIE